MLFRSGGEKRDILLRLGSRRPVVRAADGALGEGRAAREPLHGAESGRPRRSFGPPPLREGLERGRLGRALALAPPVQGQARVPQLHGVLVLARRRRALLRAPLVDQRGRVEDLLVGVAEPSQGARGGALAPVFSLEGRPRRRRRPQAPEVRRQ